MAYWTINLWKNSNGVCYVESDLLGDLKSKDVLLLKRLLKRKNNLVQYRIDYLKSSGIIKNVDEGLWELKFILPKAQIRYIGCIEYGEELPVFYALCAFRKKTNKISNKYIMQAKERQKEFLKK